MSVIRNVSGGIAHSMEHIVRFGLIAWIHPFLPFEKYTSVPMCTPPDARKLAASRFVGLSACPMQRTLFGLFRLSSESQMLCDKIRNHPHCNSAGANHFDDFAIRHKSR